MLKKQENKQRCMLAFAFPQSLNYVGALFVLAKAQRLRFRVVYRTSLPPMLQF